MRTTITAALVFFSLIGSAEASITAVGAVKALTDVNQMLGVVGTAGFDEGAVSGPIPLGQYSAQGITFHQGTLTTFYPGVTTPGSAINPQYAPYNYFPAPIGGGGTHVGQCTDYAGVVTFSVTVTQFGLTASTNGNQYLTVWNTAGAMIGQVNWVPGGSSFVGIDTLGVPIGMFAFGNTDLFAGGAFTNSGSDAISDTWMWATGKCANNAQCDDQNVCTTDTCTIATGACVHANNTVSCTDSNSCTQNDVCSAGVCVPGAAVVCTALDSCHTAGVCNPLTGVCSTPTKPDTSACNDGNACTQADTCTAGVCSGQNPVVCPAPDACHTAGSCNVATGVCSNPAKANGTACNDNNACTQADSCQAGVCTGQNPIVCAALDGCHTAGVCNPMSGVCSTPTKPNGSACNDANACTQTDTCNAGVCSGQNPVTCPAPDACHTAGSCNMATGMCSNPAKADGTACNDNNACTQADSCQVGVCTGQNPITCAASDDCHTVGICNTMTGACTNPALPDDSACDDGDACTQADVCQAGTCLGQTPVVCVAANDCQVAGTCDPATGVCANLPKPDGTTCDDANACTKTDTCMAGLCAGGGTVTCALPDACHDVGVCDPASGMCAYPAKADGTTCNDAEGCTTDDKCTNGVCAGAGVDCKVLDACHTKGTCSGNGVCSNPSVTCAPPDSVCKQPGSCDLATGKCAYAAKPDGAPCGNGVCVAGLCSDEMGNTTSATSATSGGMTTGAGGASGVTGAGGAGGAGAGGASSVTGAGGASGVTGAGGAAGPSANGATSTSGGDGSVSPAGGCGCSVPESSPTRTSWLLLGLLLPIWRRRRRTA